MIVVFASTDARNELIKKLRSDKSEFFTRLYNRNTVYRIWDEVVQKNILFLTDEEKRQVPWWIDAVNRYIKSYNDNWLASKELSEATSAILTAHNK